MPSCSRAFILFIVLFVSISTNSLQASHIVGGELTYRCLGNDRFEISMTIYRDCWFGNPSVWFDNPAFVGIFDGQNNLIRNLGQNGVLRMRLRGVNDTLAPVLNNPCYVAPPSVCVHRTIYRDTLDLPYRPGGYQLAYQRCCRNETIVNITDPAMTGATFYAFIGENALQNCNNSAVFKQWPPIYICQGEKILFDHSAFDLDGDSLVYSLCTPITGGTPNNPHPNPPASPPYPFVDWKPGFGLSNVLGSIDPLRIDQNTGLLQGTPDFLGQFVVGVCVDEYRAGYKIGTTRRDFQYNVGSCGVPAAVFATDSVSCSNELFIQNLSQFAQRFKWIINGPNNLFFETSTVNLQYTLPTKGRYIITLIAEPGTSCADTIELPVTLADNFFSLDLDVIQENCGDSITLNMISKTGNQQIDIDTWTWKIFSNTIDTLLQDSSISIRVPFSPIWSIIHFVETSNGCRDTITYEFEAKQLIIPPFDSLYSICPGDTILVNIDTNDSLLWKENSDLLNPVNSKLMGIIPSQNSSYDFVIFNDIGCEYNGSILVNLFDELPFQNIFAIPDTIRQGESSQLTSIFYPNYLYQWTPSSSLDEPQIPSPKASPNNSTSYTLQFTSPDGCSAEYEVLLTVINLPCEETHIFIPNAFSPNNDGVNEHWNVRSINLDSFTLMVYDRWGKEIFRTQDVNKSWNGTYRGNFVPKGSYGFYFEGVCPDGSVIKKQGNVTLF
jgi:gliding motility-associated-like protein